MGKSDGMVIICPTGDHMLRNGQDIGNSSASLKWRCQKVPSEDPHACSVPRAAVMHLELVGCCCTPPLPVML